MIYAIAVKFMRCMLFEARCLVRRRCELGFTKSAL